MGWTTQDWILTASLLVNLVFALALFFKSALNEIATHRYKAWKDKKERERQILLELNERMHTFDTNYFMSCVWQMSQHNATSLAEKATAGARVTELGAKIQGTLGFFAKHDLEFPAAIRVLIADLRNAMVFKDVNLVFDGREVQVLTAAVTEAANQIKKHVGELVGRR